MDKLNILEVLNGTISEIDTISEVRGKNMFINTLPIKVDDKIRGAVAFIREVERIENINRKLKENLYVKGFVAKHYASDVKGKSDKIKSVLEKAKKYAATDATLLIQGETGTGKGIIAEAIHNMSSRKKEPFVAVNCPALPESLLESELFGYEEGAFTGAKRGGRIGLFEMANKGTIFLDEIADIPHSIQVRLLRVIEAKEVMRVGGDRYVPVDVRIISSSNKDLRNEVENGNFRKDLFYRLAFLKLTLPPLRERLGDIPYIIEDLIEQYEGNFRSNCKAMIEKMSKYLWLGNVRELRSFVESYFIILNSSDDPKLKIFNDIFEEYIPKQQYSESPEAQSLGKINETVLYDHLLDDTDGSLKDQLRICEKIIIDNTLRDCQFKKKMPPQSWA